MTSITQFNFSVKPLNDMTSDERRARLDQLATSPMAEDQEYTRWVELYKTAVQAFIETTWADGLVVEIGGGAALRCADQLVTLVITESGVTHPLGDFGYYNPEQGRYCWIRDAEIYRMRVRDFRSLLRLRHQKLQDAYAAAKQSLPAEVNGRLEKGLSLAIAGAVTILSNAEAMVRSASDPTRSYHVNGRCECTDARRGAPMVAGRPACKHQIAVWLTRKAQGEQQPDPKPALDILDCINQALAADAGELPQPKEVKLVVKHVTGGGAVANHVDAGEVVEVVEDGRPRAPKTSSLDTAITWLMGKGYTPAGFKWLDTTGLVRRREYAYQLA